MRYGVSLRCETVECHSIFGDNFDSCLITIVRAEDLRELQLCGVVVHVYFNLGDCGPISQRIQVEDLLVKLNVNSVTRDILTGLSMGVNVALYHCFLIKGTRLGDIRAPGGIDAVDFSIVKANLYLDNLQVFSGQINMNGIRSDWLFV